MKKILIALIIISTGFVNAQNPIGESTQSSATERNNARLIVEDDSGNLHVAYYDNGIYYSFSDDAGTNWSTPFLIDETGRNPSLAVDNDNILHLVYKYGGTSAYDIVHRTYNEEIWSEFDVVYHDEVTEVSRPVIAVDSENNLHCVWQRSGYTAVPNSEIWYSKFTSGTGWETPVNISNSYGASEYPTITIDNDNNIYVFWKDSGEDIGNDKMVLYRKYTVGIGWDAAYTNISNTTGNGSYATMDPCAVTDTDGNIHLVWKDSETGNREIFYKKCTNGVWDIGYTNISNTAEASAHPSISTDSQGNLRVFWAEKIGGIYYEIVYIKYDIELEIWTELVNISDTESTESEHPNAPNKMSNLLSVIWTEGNASPFSVMYYGELFSLPNAPNLISPPNGSTGISHVSVELEWSSLAEATNYQYQYCEDNTFSTGVIDGTTTSLTTTITDLNESTTYYWRVRGQNADGNSPWSSIWSFTTNFQFLEAPSLTAPSNGATNQPITLYLYWTDIADNVGYAYQYDTVSDFSSPVMQEGTTTTNTSYVNVSNLFFGKTYYWRAMTLGSPENSEWSPTWNFSTGTTVYNTAPSDGAINQDISLTLDWTDIIGNAGYMYQIDTSQSFNSSLLQEGTTAQNDSYIGVSDLFFGTTYYWRACALSAVDTSIWSNTWIFTTYHTVTNTSPDNGAINQDISLYLDWTDISGNSGYMYQIDTSQSFNSSLLQEGTTAQNNSYGGVSDLLFGTTYYWHACALSAVDTSIWSNTWSFTTLNQMPNAPILISPANGSTGVSATSVDLEWSSIPDATNYQYQYSEDNTFSAGVYSGTTAYLTETIVDLSENTTYYWRVRGQNSSGNSPWSVIWHFTTENSVGVLNESNISSIKVFPNPTSKMLTIKGEGIIRLELISFNGQIIGEKNIENDKSIFDLSAIPNGIYLIKVVTDKNTIYKKVIKE